MQAGYSDDEGEGEEADAVYERDENEVLVNRSLNILRGSGARVSRQDVQTFLQRYQAEGGPEPAES